MLTIYIKDPRHGKYYAATVSPRWANAHDKALISCGLTVNEKSSGGTVYLRGGDLDDMVRDGTAVEVTHDQWNHSGCQSACKLRGAKECRW